MKRERAETIGLMALAHLATDEDLLHRFLGESGMNGDDLRRAAGDPATLGGVLDFLLGDEARVLAFAAAAGLAPDEALRARYALPGGSPGDRGAL